MLRELSGGQGSGGCQGPVIQEVVMRPGAVIVVESKDCWIKGWLNQRIVGSKDCRNKGHYEEWRHRCVHPGGQAGHRLLLQGASEAVGRRWL